MSRKVGYCKPPVETQFKPGQSGNPRGRPKGSKNIATLVDQALSEKVVINLGGRRRKVSKLEAAFMQQANKAAAGDPKAVKLMLDVLAAFQPREQATNDSGALPAADQRHQYQVILASLKARVAGGLDGEEH